MTSLVDAIEGSMVDVIALVDEYRAEGRGKETLGSVPGRSEAEDVEIGLDRACQELIERWLEKTNLAIEVHSEHGLSKVGEPGRPLDYMVSVDPFDGSGLYARGIPAEWWSVLSVYEPRTLKPVAGAAADILRREVYLADGNEATVRPLDGLEKTRLSPSRKTTLGDDTVLAVYLMSPVYRQNWVDRAADFMADLASRFPGSLLWPNGGSCIYPWLARGIVDAYVSFDEPISEIDPGLAFARAAGFQAYSVSDDGKLEQHKFQPGRMADRVPFFVTACTKDLARDVVKAVLGLR